LATISVVIISICCSLSLAFPIAKSCGTFFPTAFIPAPPLTSFSQNEHSCRERRPQLSVLSMTGDSNMGKSVNKRHRLSKVFENRLTNKISLVSKAKSSLKSLKYLVFVLPLLSDPRPANAVYGSLPTSPKISTIPGQEKKEEQPLIKPDPGDPKYVGAQDQYELDLRIYERKLKAKEEKERKEKESHIQSIRPSQPKTEEELEAQRRALALLQQSSPTSSSSSTDTSGSTSQPSTPPKVKVSAAPKPKSQKKILTPKQKARQVTVTALRFSGFITAGVFFAKAQNSAEQKRVQKGIEIFESQKKEFFNITGKADTDEDLADELKKLKGNSTAVDDDDDEDDDDDDDYEEPVKKKKPTKPSGPSGDGSGPSPPKPSSPKKEPPVRESKASDDDIERMKNLFNK